MISLRSFRPLAIGFGIALFQLIVVLFVTGGKYAHLVQWDGNWYRDIAEFGYQVTLPLPHSAQGGSRIAFFPGFPIWVRLVGTIFHIPMSYAVNLAAELAAVGCWTYLILILKRLHIADLLIVLLIVIFFSQPGAFYLVSAYSESLFTSALLGFVYWTGRALETSREEEPLRETRADFWKLPQIILAIGHGFVLTSTRYLGVFLAIYPLFFIAYAHRDVPAPLRRRKWTLAGTISLLALGGFASFLVYCQTAYGSWNLYWEANRIGWSVQVEPKLFQLAFYTDVFFNGNLSEVLGRLITVFTLGGLLALYFKRFGGAISLLALELICATIIGSHGMHSMVRYLIPIHALALPVLGVWFNSRTSLFRSPRFFSGMAAVLILLLAIQVMFAIRYSRTEWVS